jgi:hypothetical protein
LAIIFFDGEDWVSDPYAYDQAVRAINAVLEAHRPRGKIAVPHAQMGLPQEVFTQLGEGFAKDLLAAVAKKGGGGMVREDVVRAIRDRLGSPKK